MKVGHLTLIEADMMYVPAEPAREDKVSEIVAYVLQWPSPYVLGSDGARCSLPTFKWFGPAIGYRRVQTHGLR
jgi:hypothetical protein